MKDLPEVKTLNQANKFAGKFMIMDFLPCSYKIQKSLVVIQFPKTLLHILQQTNEWLNIGRKIFYHNCPEECILRGQFQHISSRVV